MEGSPAAGGRAPGDSSESELHLLSVNRDSLGEGIIKYVPLGSELKCLRLIIVIGPKVLLASHTNGDLKKKSTNGHELRGLLEGQVDQQHVTLTLR